jgi:hypothetical protein
MFFLNLKEEKETKSESFIELNVSNNERGYLE